MGVDVGSFHPSFTNTHGIVNDWVLETMQFTATGVAARARRR